MTWLNLELKPNQDVQNIGSFLQTALNTYVGMINELKAALLTAQVQTVNPLTATQQAINESIQTLVLSLKEIIDQLLLSSGVYGLLIPIPKRSLIDPRSVTDDQDRNLVNPSYFPIGPFFNQLPAEQRARLYDRIDFAHLFDPSSASLGGNAYLIKTVAESLFDAGDLQRPRWNGSMYWASVEIVIGAADYSQIAGLLLFVDNLFSGMSSHGQNLTRNQTSLVPQSLSATIAYPETTSTPAVILSWPPLSVGKILSSFDSATLVPTRMAVIRSTDFRAQSALRVSDLFGGPLTQGATGQYGAKVIFEGDFDGISNRYTDNGPFTEGTDYVYHVAFKTRLESFGTQPVVNEYSTLSPAISLHYSAQHQGPQSISVLPDWIRTPSVLSLIPPLAQFLTKVRTYLDTFAASSQSFANHEQAYAEFLDRQINKFNAKATEVVNNIQRLTQIFGSSVSAGGYVRVGKGQGTVASYLADFVEALTDQSDETRPKFDDGTEYTAGLIFLAAGPDPTAVASSIAFLEGLFGPASTSPAQAAIAQISQVVAQAEQTALNTLLTPSTPASNTFAPDGTPLPPGTPDPNC